jgi:hypothetical protein
VANEQTFAKPAVYEIRVRGVLSDRWADWFDGLAIIPQENGETLLVGTVVDQSALHGILDTIHGLNLPLMSVCRSADRYP